MALNFLQSSHRRDYLSIAVKYKVSPNRVYLLNHGIISPVNDKDKQIIDELYRRNIKFG